jgi:hypothetical protein
MNVNQRGNQTGLTANTYTTDRFFFAISGRDELVCSIEQSTDVPSGSGFANSLKYTTTTPESSIATDEYANIWQKIEAQNLQHLAYGTSSAKKLTLSFWVKSSVTGTFCVGIYKDDTTGQIHNKTYTISSASTWEYKTITFEANSLSGGAIANNNGIGVYLTWHLASGNNYDSGSSTSSGWANYSTTNWCAPSTTDAVITTTNATFQLTGIQLEVGSQSTPFEHEPVGVTLDKCERYFQTYSNRTWNGINEHAANYKMFVNGVFRQKMRATPTGSFIGTVNVATPQVGVTQRPNAFQGLSSEGWYFFKWPSSGTYGGSLGTHGDAKYYVTVGAGPTNRIDFDAEL